MSFGSFWDKAPSINYRDFVKIILSTFLIQQFKSKRGCFKYIIIKFGLTSHKKYALYLPNTYEYDLLRNMLMLCNTRNVVVPTYYILVCTYIIISKILCSIKYQWYKTLKTTTDGLDATMGSTINYFFSPALLMHLPLYLLLCPHGNWTLI